MRHNLLLGILIGLSSSCGAITGLACYTGADCIGGQTRCHENEAQICSAGGVWTVEISCTDLSVRAEGHYQCAAEPEGAVCVEVEAADAG